MSNPTSVVTEKRLGEFYQEILPYLGGMPEMLANKFSRSDIYSTTEKIVGQWTDGKPVYQKTVTGTIPTAKGFNYISMGVSVDKYIKMDMICTGNGSAYQTQRIIGSSLDATVRIIGYTNSASSNANKIGIEQVMTTVAASGQTVYIIVQYTKTTDSATSIGVDTDYSTTEKIIGTWIGGKPLYQKTINFGALPNTTTKEVASGLSNITVVDIKVIANSTGYSMTVPYISSDSNKHVVTPWYDYSTNKIGIATTNDRSAFSAYVTLQYTKTT